MILDAKATKGGNLKCAALLKHMASDDGALKSTSFNDATWGAVTCACMQFVNGELRLSSLEKIIKRAKELMIRPQAGGSRGTSDTMDVNGTHVQMVDLLDSECNCKHN